MGNTEKLLNQIMDLKFTSKSLQRQARKCEKEEKSEKLKVKKAIEKGNMDGARIYAENAIRKRSEQMNYLRLASRLDAVVARLDTQAKMTTINKSMASIVKSLESSLATGNLQKMSETMDQFEKQFVNMEVQAEFMENAMAGSTSLSTPRLAAPLETLGKAAAELQMKKLTHISKYVHTGELVLCLTLISGMDLRFEWEEVNKSKVDAMLKWDSKEYLWEVGESLMLRWQIHYLASAAQGYKFLGMEWSSLQSPLELVKNLGIDKTKKEEAYRRYERFGHLMHFRNNAMIILSVICLQLPFELAYAHLMSW
ncbi:hypothetical protein GH714_031181 [Hevea brasiliensis]|uniref:Uncharacterized protein n=1 Tax=Hevea brasiliensis TaxID=3981 RepID=A0A6A6LPJ4_HEVBR|nr:hypothetical protein GH714_031181 [Hevea brasiliensis]